MEKRRLVEVVLVEFNYPVYSVGRLNYSNVTRINNRKPEFQHDCDHCDHVRFLPAKYPEIECVDGKKFIQPFIKLDS